MSNPVEGHVEIHGRMRKSATTDPLDPGFGDRPHRIEPHAAGGLQLDLRANGIAAGDRSPQGGQSEGPADPRIKSGEEGEGLEAKGAGDLASDAPPAPTQQAAGAPKA